MYDIIVIGAGPAGLTASIYARRANKSVLVLEASNYGGQIINTLDIENYPVEEHISGYDFATKLYNQAKNLGAEIVFEKAIKVSKNGYIEVDTNKNNYKSKTLIIATGLVNRKLNLTNLDQLVGRGISYCATCDGSFYKGKDVAVVGGGNVSLEDALYLSNLANKVYLIHRREEFRGLDSTLSKLKEKDNVEFLLNSNVTKLDGTDKLKSIEVSDNLGNKISINVAGLFLAIGKNPDNKIFNNLIKLDENGYIIAGEDCKTNVDGIYVAGDTRVKEVRQLVTATSDGAVAAVNAIKYINNLGKEE